jgi:transposase
MSPELWNQIPPEAQKVFLEMAATVQRLEERIAELEARVNQTPQNSSRPPSSQHPHAKPISEKPPSKRKPGGQFGHPKHERKLVPMEELFATVPLIPEICRCCGKRLAGCDPAPLRHQVYELPEIKPLITEYQRHRLDCGHCGHTTCAPLPDDVPQGQTGPRLTAAMGLLMAACRQSKRKVAWLSENLFNTPCSIGLTIKLENLTTAALRGTYDELLNNLNQQLFLNIDETGTKEKSKKCWLWTFAAQEFTVFVVRPNRSADVLDELFKDDFLGVVGCDRAKMYWGFDKLQWCWAHLKRDFQAIAECSHAKASQIGIALSAQTKILFRHWGRFGDGKLTREALKKKVKSVRTEVERLLQQGLICGHNTTEGTCGELLRHRKWMWTFLDHEGVEPTNNAAERSLRHAVIWRKLSFGTQSAAGSRFVETLLTIIETCRQQQKNVFEFVTDAVSRLFAGHPHESLLNNAAQPLVLNTG